MGSFAVFRVSAFQALQADFLFWAVEIESSSLRNEDTKVEQRRAVLSRAFDAHPERFTRGRPTPAKPRDAVWINPRAPNVETTSKEDAVA